MEDKEVLLFEAVFDSLRVQERAEVLGHVIAQPRHAPRLVAAYSLC